MKKKIYCVLLSLLICINLVSCSSAKSSEFYILFMDVGQGDAALVCCDGHHMLIDGGDKGHAQKVYDVLLNKNVDRLDILVLSHLHGDHIGGIPKALTIAQTVDLVLSPIEYDEEDAFRAVVRNLNGTPITVPAAGDKYTLGSAKIEVVDVGNEDENDSLVLLISYGKTTFLFTGDIGDNMQRHIVEKFNSEYPWDKYNEDYNLSLMKVPHHGSGPKDYGPDNILYSFMNMMRPQYAVISVGENNRYKHPYDSALKMLEDVEAKVYRTDLCGDIMIVSDGKKLEISTSK